MACMYILFSFLFYRIVEMKFNLNILQLFFFLSTFFIRTDLMVIHARIQTVLSGSNFENLFFLVDEWRKDQNTTLSGQSSARQPNAI